MHDAQKLTTMTTSVPAKAKKPRMVKTIVPLSKGSVAIYFGPRIAAALEEVTLDMTLYKGVRLAQVLEAVYQQGKKDGARQVFESFHDMMKAIPHKNPGKPKKKK